MQASTWCLMISLWLLKLMFNPYCLLPPIKLSLLIKIDWLCFVFGSGPILLTYTESVSSHQRIFQHIQHLSRFWHALFLRTSLDGLAIGDRRFSSLDDYILIVMFFFFILFSWLKSFLILTWPCDTIHLGCSPQSTKYFYSHAQQDQVICAEYQCWPTKLNFVHFC